MRITLTTFGSYGDLHPTIALGLALQKAGHSVLLGTSEVYRQKIERTGLGFAAIRPDQVISDTALIAKALHPVHGPRTVIRDLADAAVEDTYQDLEKLVAQTDLFITSPLSLATVLIATKYRLPWISTVLAPISFFSTTDPPMLPNLLPIRRLLRASPPAVHRLIYAFGRAVTSRWCRKTLALARTLGLSQIKHPIFEDQFSPYGTLALFSPVLGAPQVDWPPKVVQTGFLFYDKGESPDLPPGLEEFLGQGPAPVVVTLGSIMMMDARDFFVKCAAVARTLKQRVVLLYGRDHPQNIAGISPGTDLFMSEYAPYSKIFPHASVIIHQGGVGTTAQALAAGRPTLIVPFSHDQPDNAYRMERLGISKTIERRKFSAKLVTEHLQTLLSDSSYRARAQEMKSRLAHDRGEGAATEAIAELIQSLQPHAPTVAPSSPLQKDG